MVRGVPPTGTGQELVEEQHQARRSPSQCWVYGFCVCTFDGQVLYKRRNQLFKDTTSLHEGANAENATGGTVDGGGGPGGAGAEGATA